MTNTIDEVATLDEMKRAVYDCNVANGWFTEDRAFGVDVALLHSEIAEMFEAYRDWGTDDKTEPPLPCDCAVSTSGIRGMHHSTDCAKFKLRKPEGVGSEAADILVRILDTAHRHPELGLTLPRTLADTPQRTVNADLEFGEFIDMLHTVVAKLHDGSTLAQVLICLKGVTDFYAIDLQWEFDRKLAFNKTRGFRHGGKRV